MSKQNKIVYGLKNLHIFPITDSASSLQYGSALKVEGAKSISISKKGESKSIFADDIEYITMMSDSGYEGTINILNVTDELLQAISDIKKDSKNVYSESAQTIAKPFALAFELNGDAKKIRYVFYNVVAEIKEIASKTKEKEIEPNEIVLNIKVSPNPFNMKVFAKTGIDVDQTTYDNWFTQPYTSEA